LTSSNPVVRFGTVGSSQPSGSVSIPSTRNQGTAQLVASAVPQQTTVTVTASLGAQTQTGLITVRLPF
jgi:hypothetical protein